MKQDYISRLDRISEEKRSSEKKIDFNTTLIVILVSFILSVFFGHEWWMG